MKVTAKDVESVAILSRLELKETDMEKYTKHLNAFLEYADVMTSLNTDGVKPTDHVLPLQNIFREDVVKHSLDRELALSNAPQREDGYFKVPKILED